MRRFNQGFTLIEIMIVIAIIGIVVTISAPLLTEYVKKPTVARSSGCCPSRHSCLSDSTQKTVSTAMPRD